MCKVLDKDITWKRHLNQIKVDKRLYIVEINVTVNKTDQISFGSDKVSSYNYENKEARDNSDEK